MGRGSRDREIQRNRQLNYLTDKVSDLETLLEMYREQNRYKSRAIQNLEKIAQAQREIIATLERRLDTIDE